MASVDITGLRKLYGEVVALSEISISIPSGSFFTLLGPSGCGKTTLLRTIAGFHAQTAGTIQIDGNSIENLPAYQRDVAMVFQDYAVFPHLSVRDNVAFGLKQRRIHGKEITQRVNEVLEVVQLGHLAERMPHELSGGQQQRVGLARAIVVRPKVLLMDEPLSNLDAKLRVELRSELRRIQRDLGVTTVYVTHDQEEALAMSDTVCVMYGGVIQQAASPLDIYLRPINRFVASFVGANNFLKVKRDGAKSVLAANGAEVSVGGDASVDAVCALRPEDCRVLSDATHAGPDDLVIPVRMAEVSFIGREVEVFAVTDTEEEIKAVIRPDPAIIALESGSRAFFATLRSELSFFEDSDTGARLS